MIAFIFTKIFIGLVCLAASGTALGLFFFGVYVGTAKGREMGLSNTRPDADTDFVDTDFPPPSNEAQRLHAAPDSAPKGAS